MEAGDQCDDSTVQMSAFRVVSRIPISPMRTGFAEWLLGANPLSKVASVSGKDRGDDPAGLPHEGNVYWLTALSVRFITSTYYRTAYPEWVTAFNTGPLQVIVTTRRESDCACSCPSSRESDTSASRATACSYFPHRFSDLGRRRFSGAGGGNAEPRCSHA